MKFYAKPSHARLQLRSKKTLEHIYLVFTTFYKQLLPINNYTGSYKGVRVIPLRGGSLLSKMTALFGSNDSTTWVNHWQEVGLTHCTDCQLNDGQFLLIYFSSQSHTGSKMVLWMTLNVCVALFCTAVYTLYILTFVFYDMHVYSVVRVHLSWGTV